MDLFKWLYGVGDPVKVMEKLDKKIQEEIIKDMDKEGWNKILTLCDIQYALSRAMFLRNSKPISDYLLWKWGINEW